ncbi:hypothetical protein C8R47DRAFT_173716 [Mycena vitilis]|nr:hypothetical protein C8R47DRAFT_173716 [Mycena vitilis]
MLEQDDTAFPALRRLTLFSSVDCHPRSILARAPLLTELGVESLPPVTLLSPSLTKLELRRRITFATLFDVFCQCPLLIELIVGIQDYPLPEGRPPITLPHLQSLVIRGTYVYFLTLPALRRLDVLEFDYLPALVARSDCYLQHLSIGIGYPSPFSELPTILRAVPTLTSLTLDAGLFTSSLAEMFDQDPTLLPLLTTLQLSAWHHAVDFLALIQILRARCAP